MSPKRSKPSTFLSKCSIAVVGNLGRDAKVSDIEKWTINNGGSFKSKIDGGTTHVICTWETYKKENFALPKKYSGHSKIQFVEWGWMDETLQSRRVKAVKKYLHSRKWNVKSVKKAVRRQALLSGKTEKEIEQKVVEEEFGSPKGDSDEDLEEFQDACSVEIQSKQNHDIDSMGYEVYKDGTGLVFNIDLNGADLTPPEDGNYMLSLMVSKDSKVYKACWEYSEGDEEPIQGEIRTSGNLDAAYAALTAWYEHKAGKTSGDLYVQLRNGKYCEMSGRTHGSTANVNDTNKLSIDERLFLHYQEQAKKNGNSASPDGQDSIMDSEQHDGVIKDSETEQNPIAEADGGESQDSGSGADNEGSDDEP